VRGAETGISSKKERESAVRQAYLQKKKGSQAERTVQCDHVTYCMTEPKNPYCLNKLKSEYYEHKGDRVQRSQEGF
jgi:hypothetical protein